ncbi:MAG: hypothetical protein C5B50_04030 [Verrucomicrobia bacterium]|nr:MAG: hypothetical protein C5B50_04030 [Verrucomicrobiota bacterium]
MTTLNKLAGLVAVVTLCATAALHADGVWLIYPVSPPPSAGPGTGNYNLNLGDSLKVWDISGTYSEDLQGIALDYTIAVDPSGKFTGQGKATINGFEGYDFTADMDLGISGSISTAGTVTRVNLTLKMSGPGTFQGYDIMMKATANEKVEVDSANLQLIGTVSGNVTVSVPALHKSRSASIPRTDSQDTLPSGVTGDWALALNVTNSLNKYGGSGSAQVSSGTMPLLLTGTYTPKTGLSKITLKGQGAYRSCNFNVGVAFTNVVSDVKSLTGKVLGQSLKLTSDPGPAYP